MDIDKNKLLELLYPNNYPGEWNHNEKLTTYLKKLGGLNGDELNKELTKLKEEKSSILEETQDLAISNYKTFIQTADCSRQVSKEFNSIECKLDSLLEKIPEFDRKCQSFADESNGINTLRRLNALTLQKNAQLLELLELPQLMSGFIRDNLYEDALELTSYVRRLYNKHSDIPVFKIISDDVEKSWLLMMHQLLSQLKLDIQLPQCLQIIGHLRRMEVFSEAELRVKFLQARDNWLKCCLHTISSKDANIHLRKSVEITRINLFNIITQYRAIFNDDDHGPLASANSSSINNNFIFYSWLKIKVSEFLKTLETDLESVSIPSSSIESVLDQCMYFGLSFSRVGCDFRQAMVPIFVKTILRNFQSGIQLATKEFQTNMDKFTLINKNHPKVSWKSTRSTDETHAPDSLLEFYPLADYLNKILTAFNNLRLCPPIAIIREIVLSLEYSLHIVGKAILTLYSQEHQAFTPNAKDACTRMCMCFADDMLPYIQKCIYVIFPPNRIASNLGVRVQTLLDQSLLKINRDSLIKDLKHLLSTKIEPVLNTEAKNPISDTASPNENNILPDSIENEDISSMTEVPAEL